MIDFHSHILPKLDDGSESVEQSLKMLSAYADHNVDTIVATPHYYRSKESIDHFLERRSKSYQELMLALENSITEGLSYPEIVLGSEINYFKGISRDDRIEKLCIGKSRSLFIEMPFYKWDHQIMDEINTLMAINNYQCVIAHVERYLRFGNDINKLYELVGLGAVLQVNTEIKKKWNGMNLVSNFLKRNLPIVIGTDCHNMDDRHPNFYGLIEAIAKKFGVGKINQINSLSKILISDDIASSII